jgi:DNA invertase Pin-like site-specific DNA recombinase
MGRRQAGEVNVIGYVRVSTDEQADKGAGLEAQRIAIRTEAERRGWTLVAMYDDAASGKSTNGRGGLTAALIAVESGGADGLVVAKLDRLIRSLADFSALMERSRKRGWELVVLDLNVDTTTPTGEAMANMLAVFAQWERRVIGQRTREGLAVKRAQGVRLGRPCTLDPEVRTRIKNMNATGKSRAAIARTLNAEGIPTAHGGKRWYGSSVLSVLRATA